MTNLIYLEFAGLACTFMHQTQFLKGFDLSITDNLNSQNILYNLQKSIFRILSKADFISKQNSEQIYWGNVVCKL